MPGHLWQQTICWVFILLSGFCLPMGHRPLQRGALVFRGRGTGHGGDGAFHAGGCRSVWGAHAAGLGHGDHCAAAKPLRKIPPAVGAGGQRCCCCGLTYHAQLGISVLALAWVLLPRFLYQNLFTAYLGFYPEGFFSTDYFPLVPWLFLFWSGFFLYHLIGRERMEPLRRSICPALGWLGRHSLVVYLLHQPVLYGVLILCSICCGKLTQTFCKNALTQAIGCGILSVVRET